MKSTALHCSAGADKYASGTGKASLLHLPPLAPTLLATTLAFLSSCLFQRGHTGTGTARFGRDFPPNRSPQCVTSSSDHLFLWLGGGLYLTWPSQATKHKRPNSKPAHESRSVSLRIPEQRIMKRHGRKQKVARTEARSAMHATVQENISARL
jgi:hypothetical protein